MTTEAGKNTSDRRWHTLPMNTPKNTLKEHKQCKQQLNQLITSASKRN